MIENHEKLKYGDIVYIELNNQANRDRIVLTSQGFVLRKHSCVGTKKMSLNAESIIYLKDFEDDLFIIFPTMSDEYLNHKAILDEKIIQLRPKMKSQNIDDPLTRKDITKLITTFQETKKDIYAGNEKFTQQIGSTIQFGDNFILIHFTSQMFVSKHNLDALTNQHEHKLKLSDYYSDDCIFLFTPYNNYDGKANYVFSNQNLYIRKKEKNLWANNQYLRFQLISKESIEQNYNIQLQKNNQNVSNMNNANNQANYMAYWNNRANTNLHNSHDSGIKNQNMFTDKYILGFTEDQSNANTFQIKICSNYIDPSSSNLSFANPVWLCCQKADKYLVITPTKKGDIYYGNTNLNKSENDDNIINNTNTFILTNARNTFKTMNTIGNERNKNYRNSTLPHYNISFAPLDREKDMNNIYGLFNIEQLQNVGNISFMDVDMKEKLLSKIELRVSPEIEYNKRVRFRHIATKKYLGFKETYTENIDKKTKNISTLILEDEPNENCDWCFIESYIIIDREKYQKAKELGLRASNYKEMQNASSGVNSFINEEIKTHTVKKKEIVRVFHVKTQKFLSFEELEAKLNSDLGDKHITVNNLSLTKNPNDSDLVKLLPSKENHSWEISLVLYFHSVLSQQICNLLSIEPGRFIHGNLNEHLASNKKLEPILEDDSTVKNNPTNHNEVFTEETAGAELKKIKENTIELKVCFESLRDYCLNQFSRKFDISASSGKPLFYRQDFLFDQGFIDLTFTFLTEAVDVVNKFHIKIGEQKIKSKSSSTANIQNRKRSGDNVNIIDTSSNHQIQSVNNQVSSQTGNVRRSSSIQKKKHKQPTNLSNILGDILKEIYLSITRAFEFLYAVCKNHPKNKEYVFNHREIFWEYFLKYKEASDCLIDIIKDNENYMNTIIQESMDDRNDVPETRRTDLIATIINHLNSLAHYDVNILCLLSKMMKSKGKGITSSQEYIFNMLFEEKKDNFLIKITPQYDDMVFHIMFRNENKDLVQHTLAELCDCKNVYTDYNKTAVIYLAEELNLYADLCYGRNYVCIKKIRSMFPLDHLIYHICNIQLHEEILSGLINILNFVYIDIEPHSPTLYPSMIKIVTDDLKIEKINRISIKTYIPLDKFYLILCISLYLLYNIKFGKILVNTANINLIFNIIQFRLYENIEYKGDTKIKEVINKDLDRCIHNLKEDVKAFIIKNDQSKTSAFFDKIGHKFVEFNFDHEIGAEYLIFVLEHINEFFLERVIIDNIDSNMENKNIISQQFKSVSKTDILTQNNINYLTNVLIELKMILTSGGNKRYFNTSAHDLTDKSKVFLPIIKQIAKVINFILDIKKEDMINKILENIMKENKSVLAEVLAQVKDIEKEKEKRYEQKKKKLLTTTNNTEDHVNLPQIQKEKIYDLCEETFAKKVNFKSTMMGIENALYCLFNEMNEDDYNMSNYPLNSVNPNIIRAFENNYENEYLNSIVFKTLQELLIKILEVNTTDKSMTKILVKLFTRIHSQRREIIDCIKNVRLLYGDKDLKKYMQVRSLVKKLSILTEKTEIWMNSEKLPTEKLATKDTVGFKDPFSFVNTNKEDVINNNTNNFNNKINSHSTIDQNKISLLLVDDGLDSNEENFENVIKDLNMLIRMCYRKGTQNTYKKIEKLRLMQAIFFSFHLNDVLFSLIREICQVFPTKSQENGEKEHYYFKKSLEILMKQIFKLLKCMIHGSPDFHNNILDAINFCKSYDYLLDLGFLNLLCEIISKDEVFVARNIKFIMDIICKHFRKEIFINVFQYFNIEDFNNDSLINKKNYHNRSNSRSPDKNGNEIETIVEEIANSRDVIEKMTKQKYEYEIKKCNQITNLIRVAIMKIKDSKYLDMIITNFREIMIEFTLLSGPGINANARIRKTIMHNVYNVVNPNLDKKDIYNQSPTMQIMKVTSKTSNYKMKLLYSFTKIGYRLIQLNDKLQGLILKIFPLKNLLDNVLKITLPWDEDSIKNVLELTTKNERERRKKDHYIESQLKSFYKLKYNGFILYSMLNNDLQKTKSLKDNLELFFKILYKDTQSFIMLSKILEKYYGKKDKTFVIKMMKKTAYNYFFKGIFIIMYRLTSSFKKDIYKSEEERQKALKGYKEIIKEWKKIFMEMLNDAENREFYFKTLSYVKQNMDCFVSYFNHFQFPVLVNSNSNGPKVDKYYNLYIEQKNKKAKNRDEMAVLTKNKKTLKNQLVIGFTGDFVERIESHKKVNKYIKKEIKLIASKLKSKIDFHRVMQTYTNENAATTIVDEILLEQETNCQLLNIFLKFIQENHLSQKYHAQMIFLIELFSLFIDSKPEFLKPQIKGDNHIKSNFYFKHKSEELNEYFLSHCQKIFLNNGSIEVFLRILCEGNTRFNSQIFPIILNFFNNVLKETNIQSQTKFYQLFVFFPNSDNFFYYIKQLFSIDIYQNLQNDITIQDQKSDRENLEAMINLLKFFQLLTQNHFTDNQCFLRDQPSNRLSYNFVNILVDYMNMLLGKLGNILETTHVLSKYASELYYKRILAVLDTLAEFLQGPCKANQETIIDSKIIEILLKILGELDIIEMNEDNKVYEHEEFNYSKEERDNVDDEYHSIAMHSKMDANRQKSFVRISKIFNLLTDFEKSLLICKLGVVLMAIIEGRKTKDEVIKNVLLGIDFKLILIKIGEIYMKLKDKMEFFLYTQKFDEFDIESQKRIVAEAGFNLYFFLTTLYNIENEETEFKKVVNLVLKEQNKLTEIEKENLSEVATNYNVIHRAMLFFKENSVHVEIVKENILLRVFCPKLTFCRGLTPEMVKNFHENANRRSIQTKLNSLISEKESHYQTLKQIYQIELFFEKAGPFRFLFTSPKAVQIITLIISVIMNILILIGYNSEDDEDGEKLLQNVILFGMKENISQLIIKIVGIILTIFSALIIVEFITRKAPLIFRKIYLEYLKELFDQKTKKMNELEIRRIDKLLIVNGFKDFLKKIQIYIYLLADFDVIYSLIFILFSFIGLFIHPFFFAFHLIDLVKAQPTLKVILGAFYRSLKSLGSVLLILLIIVYFFALLIYYFFYDNMPDNSCSSVAMCFASLYTNIFTSGGNIGNFMSENNTGRLVRYILDIFFSIFVICILIRMFSGITADNFSSERKERETIEHDIQNTCFICGLSRDNIAKYYPGTEGFYNHLEDHSIENYFFYMFYLEEKEPSEYNGIESYIKSEIDKESILWLPIQRSLIIEEWEAKHGQTV